MILVDTDVLLDVALDRDPHVEGSAALLDRLERRGRGAFVAWHSLSNFYHLVRPAHGSQGVRDFLLDLMGFMAVATTNTDALRFAAALSMPDFEDALQVAAARSVGATVIATRNVADYTRSPIPARTPAEILEGL